MYLLYLLYCHSHLTSAFAHMFAHTHAFTGTAHTPISFNYSHLPTLPLLLLQGWGTPQSTDYFGYTSNGYWESQLGLDTLKWVTTVCLSQVILDPTTNPPVSNYFYECVH